MYENMTFESILQRMLDRIPANMDKREGSVIYDALAPAAIELQNMYIELDVVMNESFADTASRDNLIRRANERGIVPESATKAILKGVFTPTTVDVLGKRFSCGALNYVAIEKIADGEYHMQCESVGVEGNVNFGQMIPIDYIDKLEAAELAELLIPGEDEEDTEVFRNRYFKSFESQSFGGNITDYKVKTKSIDGVGGVKVHPVWNGGGTVKLVIINSDFGKPSSTLIDRVQTIIDPIQNHGEGVGVAPIGHVVTVVGCEEATVDVETNLTFTEGWDWEAIKPYVEQTIDEYFKELVVAWDSSDNLIVRISQIESKILGLTGILDVGGTTLNGVAQNLVIDSDKIPIRGVTNNV